MKKHPLAIVDIETTGDRLGGHRIIEVGVLRVEDGCVVKTFSTLVNPQRPIPPSITALTGIREADVFGAPVFAEIRRDLLEILQGCLFVAHNARFDYGFIRQELEAAGESYQSKVLCTVRLSRKLFPRFRRHNLSAIIERFGLTCPGRHRALDDAKAVWDFLSAAHEKDAQAFERAVAELIKAPTLPPYLEHPSAEWPEGPGVYIFRDGGDVPLYIGHSVNLRQRIYSHFSSDRDSSKDMAVCQQVRKIDVLETYGALGAQLWEAHLIKALRPLYNRLSRRTTPWAVIRKEERPTDYCRLEVESVERIMPEEMKSVAAVFRTAKEAKEYLRKLARQHRLCPPLLGLERKTRNCLTRQINACNGACEGEEDILRYNIRLLNALGRERLMPWPFPDGAMIEERHPFRDARQVFFVDRWCLTRAVCWREGEEQDLFPVEAGFDLDVYKVLLGYMRKHPGRFCAVREPAGIAAEHSVEL